MMNCHMSGCLVNQKHSTTGDTLEHGATGNLNAFNHGGHGEHGGNLNAFNHGGHGEHGGNLNAFNHGGHGEHGGNLNAFNQGLALGSRSASGLLLRACC